MLASFRSKSLKRFWTKHDTSGVRPDWVARVSLILRTMDVARAPDDMNLPGLGFHALSGDLAGRYAVTVSRNRRITFAWDGDDAVQIDLEDYHG